MKQYLYQLATDQAQGLRATFVKGVFFLISFFYGVCVKAILFCYKIKILRHYTLPKTVISIGNITMGGVGKTPLVEYIAQCLAQKSLRMVVLTRGYMGRELQAFQKKLIQSDEALVLEDSLGDVPVIVNPDRVKAAREALEEYPVDVFLLDDGFQQWRLKRNLDIVVIDATCPFGNGHLIPRGILREDTQSLKRAHIFVLTRTDLVDEDTEPLKTTLKNIQPRCLIVESKHVPVSWQDVRTKKIINDQKFLKGKNICSFCGIGHPKSFEMTLKNLGANIMKQFNFMDHYEYRPADIQAMNRFCLGNDVKCIVTTQKDAVKLKSLLSHFNSQIELWSLRVQIQITHGKEEFLDKILSVCPNKK